jgi:hypothetical protein
VLVFFGFALDALSDGFRELLEQELDHVGDVTEGPRFAGTTRVAVVQVNQWTESRDDGPHRSTHPNGCVAVRPAMPW